MSYFIDSLAEVTSVVRRWRVVSVFDQASATAALQDGLAWPGRPGHRGFAAACRLAARHLFTWHDLAA